MVSEVSVVQQWIDIFMFTQCYSENRGELSVNLNIDMETGYSGNDIISISNFSW